MKLFSIEKNGIGIEYKALIIVSIVLLFILAFIPLWQIGVNRTIEISQEMQSENMLRLAEKERLIEGLIASGENRAVNSEELSAIASLN